MTIFKSFMSIDLIKQEMVSEPRSSCKQRMMEQASKKVFVKMSKNIKCDTKIKRDEGSLEENTLSCVFAGT